MKRVLLVFAAVLAVLAVAVPPANAHHLPDFGPRWQSTLTPTWHFTPSVPGGDWRNRITDGMQQWNQLGETLQYRAGADMGNRDPRNSCSPSGTITMHRFNLDGGGGTLGLSGFCQYTSGAVGRATSWIIFDQSEEWCLGTGDCYSGFLGTGIGANTDLWSIASHEWGHVGALGHYAATDGVCADNDGQATMCPSYKGGTERMRTLQPHDIDSFRARY